MSPPPRAISYTALDYPSIVAELTADALSQPELEGLDLAPGSPDRRWMVAVATVGAKLAYYQNRWINEAFIGRARLRQSVIDHAAGLGYDLAPPAPEVVSVTITLPRAYADAVVIPAGTEITTEDGAVTFTTDADAPIPPGQTVKFVNATEGRAFVERVAGEASGTSPAGQRVPLAESPFARASDAVRVDGVAWTRVRNFLSSSSASLHYRVEVDASDLATVVFGDGTNGRRPPESSEIEVAYRVTSGLNGRVRRGRLRRILGSFRTAAGLPVEPAVTNPSDSAGGANRETIEHARYAAPDAMRATERTVAREDYELHGVEVAGVARVLAHTWIEDATLPRLEHRLYVVPTDGGTAGSALLSAVELYVTTTKPNTAGVLVTGATGVYRTQTVAATLTLFEGTDPTAAEAAAADAVEALFDPAARDDEGRHRCRFGHPVPRSAIIAALQGVAGVAKVVLTSPSTDATFAVREFPSLASAPSFTVLTET